MNPFPMIEKAVRELIVAKTGRTGTEVGGSPNTDPGEGVYIWISLISGSTDRIEGEWILDIDHLARRYGDAMDDALALEPILLASPHRTSGLILDLVTQNEAPSERPWEDESVSRVGATYVFTARRSG